MSPEIKNESPNEARFIDELSPKNEALWRQTIDALSRSKQRNEDVMGPIWADNDYPQVIRDRAMLTMAGAYDVTKKIGRGSTMGLPMAFGPQTLWGFKQYIPSFDTTAFYDWLQDADGYQTPAYEIVSRINI